MATRSFSFPRAVTLITGHRSPWGVLNEGLIINASGYLLKSIKASLHSGGSEVWNNLSVRFGWLVFGDQVKRYLLISTQRILWLIRHHNEVGH